MADWKPDIFTYLDYRAWLRAYYEAAKEEMPVFSFRYFSRKAGYSSPNFLKLVMEGKRNLTEDSVARFTRALQLNPAEARFFEALVEFNQAQSAEEKNAAFERVTASRRFRNARRVEQGFFQYLSTWYYPTIRELAGRPDFREDPAWIAAQLLPPIKPAQAAEAMELLLDLGLLVRDDAGRIVRGDPSLTTGHEVHALAVGNYHRQMLQRAADAIELVPPAARDISALTVCISAELVPEFKRRIHTFREALLNLGDQDPDPRRVYQLNIQLFPLTGEPEDPPCSQD
jgi:uncharacterized protein (TIGR02147 family)